MSFISEAFAAAAPSKYPLQGEWRYDGFPRRVTLAGFPFTAARWKQSYPGVVAQYREDCVHHSMHAKVVHDGAGGFWWLIDHDDLFNPDRGRPLAHFFWDYEPGRIAKPAVVAFVGLVLTRALVPLAPGL
jgi:hypothetical protein